MTKEELILRYGKDEIERTRIALIELTGGAERLAFLMERFGRSAHDLDLAFRELDRACIPTLWDRVAFKLEVKWKIWMHRVLKKLDTPGKN